jgi:hypothetical protein
MNVEDKDFKRRLRAILSIYTTSNKP